MPARRGERRSSLETLLHSDETEIFYEAPHRLIEALEDIVTVLGPDRSVVIARELTKVHEEFIRGPAGQVLERLETQAAVKGEIVLLVGKATGSGASQQGDLLARRGFPRLPQILTLSKARGRDPSPAAGGYLGPPDVTEVTQGGKDFACIGSGFVCIV